MKIKYALLNKFNELTNKEIDLILYIARYQDAFGCVNGVYYKKVCELADMCKQTFYNILASLEQKGIITYVRYMNDYDVTILNNDFSYKEAYSEGYVNVSKKVFHTKQFHDLKAKEKVLLLHLSKITQSSGRSFEIGTKKFIEKYRAFLGVTERVLRNYMYSLRKFYSIGIKDKKYYITPLSSVFKEKVPQSETDQYLNHIVLVNCRRNKIKEIVDEAVEDTMQLAKQYKREAEEQGKNIISILSNCIGASLEKAKQKILNSKFVHVLLRRELSLEHTLAEPVL